MAAPDILLAKSLRAGTEPKTLLRHSEDVVAAARQLFGAPGTPTRLGERWTRFFRLDESTHEAFLVHVRAAAIVHDIGKANDGFQRAVRGQGAQMLRHEHVSALMLARAGMSGWLSASPLRVDIDLLLSAVACHHLRCAPEEMARAQTEERVLRLHCDHPDFVGLLRAIARLLELPGEPPGSSLYWTAERTEDMPEVEIIPDMADALRARLYRYDRSLRVDAGARRLLQAVRSATIIADAAASGLTRTARDVTEWIGEAFADGPGDLLDGPAIRDKVIAPRVRQLAASGRWDRARGRDGWSEFQEEAAALPARALLLAPCGAGKTLAAWRWAESRASESPVARVIFLYPTRATATEGFRDYVSWAPESDAALLHGTASYDLQGLLSNVPDERACRNFETDTRLFALGCWPRRIFAATVDQFLSFVQHSYASTCLLPLLADSLLVVDEVHSFDRGMLSALKDLLREFEIPCLCMTATMPERRRRDLVEGCGLHLYEGRPGDLRQIATHRRYRVATASVAEALGRARAAISAGRRVLWVVNQVPRAQALARMLASALDGDALHTPEGAPLFCYHSRFRLVDRGLWHGRVIEAFQGVDGRPAIAVTTQVCEMSLDLDAQLLVTEEAPVTAMIQRMGRCNRRDPLRSPQGEVLVVPAESPLPYDGEWLAGVPEFVRHIGALSAERGGVSQDDLEEALESFGPRVAEPPKLSRFLESGPYAASGEESLRDSDALSDPGVLDSEAERLVSLLRSADRRERAGAEGLLLPTPRRFPKSGRERPAGLPDHVRLVPAGCYHPALGLCLPG